jgi:cyclophilin family peptidyl-prolyl cis-trans isomerase
MHLSLRRLMRSKWMFAALGLMVTMGCGGGSPPPPAEEPKAAPAPPAPSEEEPAARPAPSSTGTNPMVEMRTSLGTMKIELHPDKAPKTVENFLQYAREGFYDGTVFHRVISGFMIQGGGFTPDMSEKETRAPIENEASNGLKNVRGSLAMARTGDPHSASSQFFINTVDNPFLDFTAETVQGYGYAVFGQVVEGLETLDAIKKVSTASRGGYDDVPVDPVVIESVRVLN